jgi:hypothetical protein
MPMNLIAPIHTPPQNKSLIRACIFYRQYQVTIKMIFLYYYMSSESAFHLDIFKYTLYQAELLEKILYY